MAELDTLPGGVPHPGTVLAEIDTDGHVLKQWDMATIFRAAMVAGGDDPAGFVRDQVDWFHMNSAIYDPADDSLLVSSRENFVVKLDYETGRIRWLLGDPAKYWHVRYPSLRALALRVTSGKAPVGQHALSVAPDGNLLMFNNGAASLHEPPGTPAGNSPGSVRYRGTQSTRRRGRLPKSGRTSMGAICRRTSARARIRRGRAGT